MPSVTSQKEGFLKHIMAFYYKRCQKILAHETFGILWDVFYLDYRRLLPKLRPAAAAAAVSANVATSHAALLRWAPWFHCCFKLKRKHHPLAFINANKYLSTKIAHWSDHK